MKGVGRVSAPSRPALATARGSGPLSASPTASPRSVACAPLLCAQSGRDGERRDEGSTHSFKCSLRNNGSSPHPSPATCLPRAITCALKQCAASGRDGGRREAPNKNRASLLLRTGAACVPHVAAGRCSQLLPTGERAFCAGAGIFVGPPPLAHAPREASVAAGRRSARGSAQPRLRRSARETEGEFCREEAREGGKGRLKRVLSLPWPRAAPRLCKQTRHETWPRQQLAARRSNVGRFVWWC